jgi:hypothetical protein
MFNFFMRMEEKKGTPGIIDGQGSEHKEPERPGLMMR